MDKRTLLIEKATELFAKNGFETTSVQQITDACGMSKGAFYSYFKSKERILIAIFEHFTSKLAARIQSIFDGTIAADERLVHYFLVQFEEILKYSDFILMQVREQTNPGSDELMKVLDGLRRLAYDMQERLFLERYGSQVIPHLADLYVLVNGLSGSYVQVVLKNRGSIDSLALSRYIVARIDSIVKGLDEPLLEKGQLIGFDDRCSGLADAKENVLQLLRYYSDKVDDAELSVSLEVIEQEMKRQNPRKPVLSGMLMTIGEDAGMDDLREGLAGFIQTL